MTVKLIQHSPLDICDLAISKCWDTECKTGEARDARIYRVGIKNRHASTLEHIVYSFDIDGISRACLQELARHRMQSLSVKSSRYTLKELKGCNGSYMDFLVAVSPEIDSRNCKQLSYLKDELMKGTSNDIAKYMLPEAFKTSLVSTWNARSLQNFLSLRTDKSALWEIRLLARSMFYVLPEDHQYLFTDFVKEYE